MHISNVRTGKSLPTKNYKSFNDLRAITTEEYRLHRQC